MATPSIRPARPSDATAVVSLWRSLLHEQAGLDPRLTIAEDAEERWRNDFPYWLDDGTRKFLVAEHAGAIVGFAHAHRWGPPPILEASEEVYIDEVYVRPDARRNGCGRALVAELRSWAESLNANRLRLGVMAENSTGRAFWKSLQGKPLSLTYTIELASAVATNEAAPAQKRIGF